jgi:flagellar basal body rod protein FlgG
MGGARFGIPEGAAVAVTPVDEPSVVPRSLELANVSATQAMVDLIATSRGFELYAKSAQSIDQLNEQTISRVGRRSA